MRIGFSGYGRMAKAIHSGLEASKKPGNDFSVGVYKPSGPKGTNEVASTKFYNSNSELAKNSDIFILCSEPSTIPKVLNEIKEINDIPTIVSVAAGVTEHTMRNALGGIDIKNGIYRALPNVASNVQQGITLLYSSDKDIASRKEVESIFSSIGEIFWVDNESRDFHVLSSLCASAPAFVIMFAESLARASSELGIPQNTAMDLAKKMLAGTGKIMITDQRQLTDIKSQVTTKGGMTQAGLDEFESFNIDNVVFNSLKKSVTRSMQLGDAAAQIQKD